MRVSNSLPHAARSLRHLLTEKRLLVFALLASFLLGFVALSGIKGPVTGAHTSSAFTPGNLVIYRVGTGTGSLSSAATAAFLDEYTTAGAFVQAIPLPTVVNGSNKRLTAAGTSSSEGLLNRSVNASYLTLTGYDADVGTLAIAGTTSVAVNRVVGRVDASGAINTTTALSDASTGSNPRSAVSTNGTDLWVDGGAGGIRYTTLGSTTSLQLSTTVTNLRQANIFAGQLYVSDASGTAVRLGTVGSGTPTTSGQTITNLPGLPTSTGSPYAFFFADLDAGVSGLDTLYVADDTNGAGGGITKYSLVSGTWTSNGTVGTAADAYRGMTGTVSGTTVTLYITRKGGTGAAGGGELATLTDASGYNGAFTGTPSLLATAAANTAFRGVAFAPAATSTNPSGVGAANPSTVAPGGMTLLTVTVTPGTTPPSTGLAVTADLSMIGLSASQTFLDDGMNGDVTAGDNIFSYQATVAPATTSGLKTMPATITDAQMRMGTCNISVTITGSSTSPSGVGAANPNSVTSGMSTLLTVTVTPGTFPPSTGLAVVGDLSTIGGSATQTFFDDGSNGDATGSDNIFSYQATVAPATTTGNKTLPTTISDAQMRSGTANISLFVQNAGSLTPIHNIQGSGNTSPVVGTMVTTTGIVTGVKTNGFFIQTPDASADSDPNTSEGIFVFTSSAPPAAAAVGNSVSVTGTVQEFIPSQDVNSPPATEIITPTVNLFSTGNPLPAAITITAGATLVNDVNNLEKYEGMRVHVDSITTIAPTQGTVNEPNATSTSNGTFYAVVTGVARPFREPGIEVPDPLPAGAPCCIPRFDANPERLRVDSDGLVGAAVLEVTTGATIANVTGPLDYAFRTYTILPDPGTLTQGSVVGNVSGTPVPVPNADEFTVASFNMERFFDTVNDGNGAPTLTATAFNNRLNKASLVIRNMLRSPDILGIEEMENLTTLQAVANKVNTDAGTPGDYQAYLVEGNDVGGIDVGFLVKSSRVNVIDVTQFGKTTTYINPNNGQPELLNDRPPLVLRATVANPGGTPVAITVIVNHLRSLSGVDDPTDGNRVRTKRRAQAEYLANLIQARQVADPHERIMSVGDYNVFQFNDGYGDSIGTIKGTPTPSNQVVLASPDLVNPDLIDLLGLVTPASQQYSYSFDGNAQVLDHELVSANLLPQLTRIAYARNDADFPESFRNDPNRPERISDHDIAVAYFTENCLFALNRDHESFAGGGGTGTVNVTAIAGCAWTASTSSPFITINSGNMGAGDGVVGYTVAPNVGATIRSDTMTIGGHTVTVYQGIHFLDVPSNNPFYTDIGKLAARGVTLGCGGGNYCPNDSVLREQMAAFIMRAKGEFSPPTPVSQRFTDVPPSNVFYNFIDRLAVLGITLGCNPPSNTMYCPGSAVTREQMSAFLLRGLGEFDPPIPPTQRFGDVPPTNVFYNFIDRMAVLNITLGCTPDHLSYCPGDPVTRAQMAAFLVRAFDL
jgi:predicted extracellular nuclease